MGWMQALCETYDNYFGGEPLHDQHPLVPAGFIEKELHLRVDLLPDGAFSSAAVLEEKERLPAPSSPAAEGRTGSGAVPYPLCEELRYVAGDLYDYTDADHHAYYDAYREQLCAWCERPNAPPELCALRHYIERGSLVRDLIDYGVLFEDGGRLLSKWPDRKDKPVFFALGKPPEKCVVDFAVLHSDCFVPLRELRSIQESWQGMLVSSMPERQLCYASGRLEPVIYNHAKIEGNAKLISAKDGPRDFQYKGRFTEADQAYSVSYLASAKAHNTLRWLRGRQGFRSQNYGATFIAWSTACRDIIEPQDDVEDGWGASDKDEGLPLPRTEEAYAEKVNSAMAGYRAAPAYIRGSHIVMLGMEAATPGRMSLNYYQELDGSEYLERLNQWYTGCFWRLPRFRDGKWIYYVTTPTLREIAEAVFGRDSVIAAERDKQGAKSITKQIRSFNSELLSCIINGRSVPVPAAQTAFRRTCNPQTFTDKNGKWQRFDWLKCLAVTCAMEKSSNKKEDFKMPLNTENRDTSYLFGRLAAVADCAEIFAMSGSDTQHRQTNVIRYFSALQQRPGATWAGLEVKLQPYLTKMRGTYEDYFRTLLDKIEREFEDGAVSSNTPLTPHFLEGYHNQRYEILNKNKKEN